MRYQLPRTKKRLKRVFEWRQSFNWDAGFLPDWVSDTDTYMPLVPNEDDKGFCRLLAHDAVEHVGLGAVTWNTCAEELIALGSIMQSRRHDFYSLMGNDGLGSEVAQHLHGLVDLNEESPYSEKEEAFLSFYADRPTYYLDDVWVEIEYAWEAMEKHLTEEYDDTWKGLVGKGKITKTRILRLACSWLSTGYLRAERIDAKYGNYRFARGFDRIRALAKESARTLLDLSDYDCSVTTLVDFAENWAQLKIDFPYYIEDEEKRFLREEHQLIYKDGY